MTKQKKPIETLKQQKESFFNYIKTEKKYSSIIADLFHDEELENFDNMENIKQHLVQKWISKELVDELEHDYTSYLREWYYYWPIDEYPEELKETIKKNNEKLNSIKKEVKKEYNQHKELFLLNIEEFVNNKFINIDESKLENIWKSYDWAKKITDTNTKISNINHKINEEIEKQIRWKTYVLKETNWFFKKKKREALEEEITKLKEEKERLEKEKKELEKSIEEYEKKRTTAKKIEEIENRTESNIKTIMWNNGEYTDIKSYENAIEKINSELTEYIQYIKKEHIENIKTKIINIIEKKLKKEKEKIKTNIVEKIKEYINYYKYWENNNLHSIKTIYSKNRIDPQLIQIATKLWISTNDIWITANGEVIEEESIDYNFMDDVFIHTTSFTLLDEILDEWWLISTNEVNNRLYGRWLKPESYGEIKDAITQDKAKPWTKPHKDIYFSRGYKINDYWHAKEEDDNIFIVNTMTNFANRWYGVPLNQEMQKNIHDNNNTQHDQVWYSIISKSALEERKNNNSYSKIDVKDFYIFVSENKKKEIEYNSKYKTSGANIIYIPKEYSWKMNYKIYEFIKKEIELRNKEKETKRPIPTKIITKKDGIESYWDEHTWAFCETIGKNPETIFNPLKNWKTENIIKFLKKYDKENQTKNKIDYIKLNDFLKQQIENIKKISESQNYPEEIVTLTVTLLKVCKWREAWERKSYIKNIWNQLEKFWYDTKIINILTSSIENIITRWHDRKEFKETIELRCKEREIDFEQMKNFIIEISKISLNEYSSSTIISNLNKQY